MHTVTTCLMFDKEAEEAATLYVSLFSAVFGNSAILKTTHYSKAELDSLMDATGMTDDMMPNKPGGVKSVRFTLNGQEYVSVNGGPYFGKFNESVSLYVNCDTQQQIDALWKTLVEGGMEQPCGWLKDRYGVSWQIEPAFTWELMEGPDQAKSERVTAELYKVMGKIDMEKLRQA